MTDGLRKENEHLSQSLSDKVSLLLLSFLKLLETVKIYAFQMTSHSAMRTNANQKFAIYFNLPTKRSQGKRSHWF